MLYRCLADGRLLRRDQIARGACLGHRVGYAVEGSLLEWIKVKWWKLTGRL